MADISLCFSGITKPRNRVVPTNIDSGISANICVPDPELHPLHHDIVKSTIMHAPYGSLNRNSPCMLNGSCSKRCPRPLYEDTHTAEDGYPQYSTKSPSDGGFTVGINGVNIHNQWLVTYDPVLSSTFKAHINVELCDSVKSASMKIKAATKQRLHLKTSGMRYPNISRSEAT